MDNPEKLATSNINNTGRRQTKQKTQQRKLKRWATRIPPKTGGEPRNPRRELVRNHAHAPWYSRKHNNISGNQNAQGVNNAFLTLVEDIGLQQMVDFHTRNNATLDLFLTNRPSLINRLKPIPGISDHDALFIDSDVQAKLRRTISRQIFLWKKRT
jgi:hypothetical protein